jgi:hypothetical protein
VFGLSGRAGALDVVSAAGADMAVEAEVMADVDRAKYCSVFFALVGLVSRLTGRASPFPGLWW